MRKKLIALGNILMKDDGIAIVLAEKLRSELEQLGIEVIRGETDIGFCISVINEEDVLILLDAGFFGRTPGDLILIPISEYVREAGSGYPHEIHLLDLLRIHFPEVTGMVIGIQAAEVEYGYGLSNELDSQLEEISGRLMDMLYRLPGITKEDAC